MNPWWMGASGTAAVVGAATALGAAYPPSQLFGATLCRTASPLRLAITFDDGPNPALTPRLMDLLDRYQARATFFLIGRFVRACPELTREIAARGHLLGNHTETHRNLFWLGPEAVRDQLQRCQDALENITGAPAKYFRPPYGFRNPWVASTARKLGMQTVMWTLIPGDWRASSAEWLSERMQPISRHAGNAKGRGTGDILCLHDGSHRGLGSDRTRTLAALENCLPRWRDLGLKFVTISEAV